MKKRLWYLPAFGVVLILLIIASFFDLTIARTIYWANNNLSHLFAAIAIYPLGITIGFMASTLIKAGLKKDLYQSKIVNVLLIVLGVIAIIGDCYIVGVQTTSYHAYNLDRISRWLVFPCGIPAAGIGVFLGVFFYKKLNHHHLIRNYIFLAIVITVTVVLIEVIKGAMPRARFTLLIQEGDQLFSNWYAPNFKLVELAKNMDLINQEEIKSFPSGHANSAILVAFILTYLPIFFPKLKNQEVLLFYSGFVYFLIIAFSRMLIGAHYLSDTMFSGLMALCFYFVANEIYLRKLSDNYGQAI